MAHHADIPHHLYTVYPGDALHLAVGSRDFEAAGPGIHHNGYPQPVHLGCNFWQSLSQSKKLSEYEREKDAHPSSRNRLAVGRRASIIFRLIGPEAHK